ncbi:hypothetical protein MMC26_007431 [Xylographa opegraphella]|nr:hypothetical protein [Xylographa opegraphella]
MSSSPRISQAKVALTLQERYFKDRFSQCGPSSTKNNSPQSNQSQEAHFRKAKSAKSYAEEITARKFKRGSQYWKEDARKVSSELENLCDEAFNPPFAPVEPHDVSKLKDERHAIYEEVQTTQVANEARLASSSIMSPQCTAPGTTEKSKSRERPLPRPSLKDQIESKAKDELTKARDLLKRRAEDLTPGALDEIIAQIDRLMQQNSLGLSDQEYRRRVTSVPARSVDPRLLSPVKETDERNRHRVADVSTDQSHHGPRIASEPIPTEYSKLTFRTERDGSRPRIRLADLDTVPRPEPLVIRRHSDDLANTEKVIKKKSSLEQLFKSVTHSGKAQSPLDEAILRPKTRLGYNGDRDSGNQSLLDPIIETENKENEDPAYAKRHSAGLDSKKWPWFKKYRTDLGSVARDPPPTPPLKNEWMVKEEYKNRVIQEQRTSEMLIEDSSQSEHKQGTFGRRKFFKIFGMRDTKGSPDTSKLALTGNSKPSDTVHTFETLILRPFIGRDLDDTESINRSSTTSTARTSRQLDTDATSRVSLRHDRSRKCSNDIPIARRVQPRPQNWVARFLHIKPASKVFAFQVSSIKARKDIASILRDWKRYGIRDVVVDKVAGRLWARVAQENLYNTEIMLGYPYRSSQLVLDIKPVALALELFPIFVRGRRANLSVGRFTQETGAKSSFERVIVALEEVLRRRGRLIKEKKRAREMARCLYGR